MVSLSKPSSSSGKSLTFLLFCRNLPGKANLKIKGHTCVHWHYATEWNNNVEWIGVVFKLLYFRPFSSYLLEIILVSSLAVDIWLSTLSCDGTLCVLRLRLHLNWTCQGDPESNQHPTCDGKLNENPILNRINNMKAVSFFPNWWSYGLWENL